MKQKRRPRSPLRTRCGAPRTLAPVARSSACKSLYKANIVRIKKTISKSETRMHVSIEVWQHSVLRVSRGGKKKVETEQSQRMEGWGGVPLQAGNKREKGERSISRAALTVERKENVLPCRRQQHKQHGTNHRSVTQNGRTCRNE